MRRVLPALHDGHAPIYLHHAFAEAIEAFEDWQLGHEEPLVFFEGGQVPISLVFGRMRHCTDVLRAGFSRTSPMSSGWNCLKTRMDRLFTPMRLA